MFQDVWLRFRYGAELTEVHQDERFTGRGNEIYDLIRDDVAKYAEAGIDLSKFPTLNQVMENEQTGCS